MKPCITHHHACDCREARFAETERQLQKAVSIILRIVKIEDSHGMGVIGWSEAMDDARKLLNEMEGKT